MLFRLSIPMLLVVGAAIGLLVWSHGRTRLIPADALPWMMTGIVLVALAMVILLIGAPAPQLEQAARVGLLLESLWALWLLDRRSAGAWRRGGK